LVHVCVGLLWGENIRSTGKIAEVVLSTNETLPPMQVCEWAF